MKRTNTKFEGLFVFEPTIHKDSRGYFMESFKANIMEEIHFIQDNEVSSTYGVIRGLHYQDPPFAQTKLIRVLNGSILDVAVDLRAESKTFGKVFTKRISANDKQQVLIPKGFAHGYAVLSKEATVLYKVDLYYNKEADKGIFYDDLGINWSIPLAERKLSEKDLKQPTFRDIKSPF